MLPTRHLLLLCLVAAVAAAGCRADQAAPAAPTVSIMTFNVENLFDNRDDPGKDDRTYLPLAAKQTDEHKAACAKIEVDRWRGQCLDWDWSDALVTRKLERVAGAILQVNDGRGPDIVALQEVENIDILNRLREDYLQDAGYRPPVLIEGTDARGIDVAFLTRLPLAGKPALHPIEFDESVPAERVADTRGLLEATFELPDGSLLTGYSVHFPAPFHPTPMRESAYRSLNALQAALPAGRPAFAAGDFNTTSTEDARERMLERYARPQWVVTHEVGCQGCKGTSYYARDDNWSFLDMVLWSPAEGSSWELDAASVRIANAHPEQRREDGTPKRFDAESMSGVSDHWPVVVEIAR